MFFRFFSKIPSFWWFWRNKFPHFRKKLKSEDNCLWVSKAFLKQAQNLTKGVLNFWIIFNQKSIPPPFEKQTHPLALPVSGCYASRLDLPLGTKRIHAGLFQATHLGRPDFVFLLHQQTHRLHPTGQNHPCGFGFFLAWWRPAIMAGPIYLWTWGILDGTPVLYSRL